MLLNFIASPPVAFRLFTPGSLLVLGSASKWGRRPRVWARPCRLGSGTEPIARSRIIPVSPILPLPLMKSTRLFGARREMGLPLWFP